MSIIVREPTEDEVEVWTIAVGNLPRIPFLAKKGTKKAIALIKEQEGFIGFYPMRPNGTLCLFDSENHAKGARNILRLNGARVGDNISTVYIEKRYL